MNAPPVRVDACFLRNEHPAGEVLAKAGITPLFLRRTKWDPRALADVVGLITRRRIDIVHAAGQKGMLIGGTAARLAGRRAIMHLHDVYSVAPALRIALKATLRTADVALCVSESVRRHTVHSYGVSPAKSEVLLNGIDPYAWAEPPPADQAEWRASVGIPPDVKAVGIIGRVCPGKGHARLLRQMPRILADVPDARLVVIGDGKLRTSLEELTAAVGIESAVCFVGQQEDMRTVLAALDVVAIPSDSEGLPFVALEAAAAGKPVVASDVSGLNEVVRDGESGILFPLEREDLLGEAIVTVLRDPVRATSFGAAARDGISRFAIDDHVLRLRDVYLRLAHLDLPR